MAVFSQLERRLISQRTREAAGGQESSGRKAGTSFGLPSKNVKRIIENRAAGDSLRSIAMSLAADEVPTAQGGSKWHASTVKAVLEGQAARTLMEAVASA
jgi:DNA invertase Pin-like site-specific DNA recombinase